MNGRRVAVACVIALSLASLPPAKAAVLGPAVVTFVDPTGQPVQLGTAAWTSGSAQAASRVTVTALGQVTFPYVPYGAGTVSIEGIPRPQGVYLSETWPVTFDGTPLTLTLRADPVPMEYNVLVTLPNGIPVPNAVVSIPNLMHYTDIGAVYTSDGGTFLLSPGRYIPVGLASGFAAGMNPWVNTAKTDTSGVAHLKGFRCWLDYPCHGTSLNATVTYNDGVILQTQSMTVGDANDVTVQLSYMPWLEVDSATYSASANSLVPINVSVAEPLAIPSAIRSAVSGVKVSVIPPKGAKQKCRNRVLSTTTGLAGTARLKVCATKSGSYSLVTSGAVSAGSVMLLVRKAAPMPPTSLGAVSLSSRTATIAWGRPTYAGGARIIKYTVVATSGRSRVTYVVRSKSQLSSRTITIRRLAANRVWRVSVTATTKYGTSDSATTSVIVQ